MPVVLMPRGDKQAILGESVGVCCVIGHWLWLSVGDDGSCHASHAIVGNVSVRMKSRMRKVDVRRGGRVDPGELSIFGRRMFVIVPAPLDERKPRG